MKYKCPQCGNEFVIHWYDNTHNFKCSQCEHPVFEQHKKRLRILNGFISGVIFFFAFTISRINQLELLGAILVFVVVGTILLLVGKFIEGKICKDLRVR